MGLLVGLLLLSACGGGDGGSDTEPSTGGSSSSDSPAPSDGPAPSGTASPSESPEPTLTAGPVGRAVTVSGVVSIAPEERCTVLTDSSGGGSGSSSWVLVGQVGGLSDGDRVTVRGRADTGTASRCQHGAVLVVDAVEMS